MVERDGTYLDPGATPWAVLPGRKSDVLYRTTRNITVDDPAALDPAGQLFVDVTVVDPLPKRDIVTATERDGYMDPGIGTDTWWESFHVLPRSFEFGNLLSTQSVPIEIYSAFRRDDHNWTDFVNNAGAGVTIVGQPSLPHTFVPQSDGGLTLSLQVSTSGQSVVDSTLDWVFGTVPQTIPTPITLQRVVLFAIQPELPFTEHLKWLTEVLEHVDGTEQRISARKNPRQAFEWEFFMEDGPERAFFHNVLFDWQSRLFGLPIWYEATRVSSAVVAGSTTVTVQSTDYADYRVGGLYLIFTDKDTFDVIEVSSLTSTSLVGTSGTNSAYPTGTLVMPLRIGTAQAQIAGSRYISGDAKTKIMFTVDDNDVDLADLTAWSSYKSKLLIDAHNSVRGSTSEMLLRDIVEFDNPTGLTSKQSPWAQGKRGSQLALLAKGQQGLWEVRQMLHAIRGKQTSFYCSTFTNDFTIDADIPAGGEIAVANVGYTQFAAGKVGRDQIRIEYNNGDADDLREIVSSVEVDTTREALTLDGAVAAHSMSEIKKIQFVEKVRYDSDDITIRHELGETTTRITGPVKTVFD